MSRKEIESLKSQLELAQNAITVAREQRDDALKRENKARDLIEDMLRRVKEADDKLELESQKTAKARKDYAQLAEQKNDVAKELERAKEETAALHGELRIARAAKASNADAEAAELRERLQIESKEKERLLAETSRMARDYNSMTAKLDELIERAENAEEELKAYEEGTGGDVRTLFLLERRLKELERQLEIERG